MKRFISCFLIISVFLIPIFAQEEAETPSNSVINYDQYTIKSSYAKVNRENGAVFAKNTDVKSVDGNEFSANQAKGNTNDVVHFTGNVKGKSKQKEGDVFFTGTKVI